MNSFSKILSLAFLAYTTSAASIRAKCRMTNADGDRQGFFAMKQEMLESGDYDTTTLSFFVKELENDTAYSMVILENTTNGGECLAADASDPMEVLYDGTSNGRGKVGVRGQAVEGVEISEELYDG